MTHTNNKSDKWEKEFDWIKWKHNFCQHISDWSYLSADEQLDDVKKKLRLQERQQLIDEVVGKARGLKRRHITQTKGVEDEYEEGVNPDWIDAVNEAQLEIDGYNQAIDDIITLLVEMKEV